MKKIVLSVVTAFLCFNVLAQENNLKDGFMAEGYDVVDYFSNKAVKGKSSFISTYKEAKYKFSTANNKSKFESNPTQYVPQYGGWCAYAMGVKGDLVSIDPETFEIRDGKLYLFYNSWGINTYKSWVDEGAEQLRSKADSNWQGLVKGE